MKNKKKEKKEKKKKPYKKPEIKTDEIFERRALTCVDPPNDLLS